MGDLSKQIFGGTDTTAMDLQMRRNVDLQAELKKRAEESRARLMEMLPPAQRALMTGSGAALDVLSGALPQQTGAITAGSVGGQAQLLAGLPQIQNAILGRPIDFSVLQPVAVSPDLGFASPTLAGGGASQSAPRMPNVNALAGAQAVTTPVAAPIPQPSAYNSYMVNTLDMQPQSGLSAAQEYALNTADIQPQAPVRY